MTTLKIEDMKIGDNIDIRLESYGSGFWPEEKEICALLIEITDYSNDMNARSINDDNVILSGFNLMTRGDGDIKCYTLLCGNKKIIVVRSKDARY